MTTPNKISFSWKPATHAEIAGKAHLYTTARIAASGECVRVLGHRDGTFTVRGQFGVECYGWRELDSFVL